MVKGVGVDCSMLLVAVYHAGGLIPDVEPRPYPPDWHLHRSEEKYLGWLQQLGHEVAEPEVGDVVVWRFGRCFAHGGIYIGGGEIVHAYLGKGCILGRLDEPDFLRREHKVFSIFPVPGTVGARHASPVPETVETT